MLETASAPSAFPVRLRTTACVHADCVSHSTSAACASPPVAGHYSDAPGSPCSCRRITLIGIRKVVDKPLSARRSPLVPGRGWRVRPGFAHHGSRRPESIGLHADARPAREGKRASSAYRKLDRMGRRCPQAARVAWRVSLLRRLVDGGQIAHLQDDEHANRSSRPR
jgi:hypothetical protein